MRACEAALASKTVVRARCGGIRRRAKVPAAAGEGGAVAAGVRRSRARRRIILIRIFASDFLVVGAGGGAIARPFGKTSEEIQGAGSVLRRWEQSQVRRGATLRRPLRAAGNAPHATFQWQPGACLSCGNDSKPGAVQRLIPQSSTVLGQVAIDWPPPGWLQPEGASWDAARLTCRGHRVHLIQVVEAARALHDVIQTLGIGFGRKRLRA